MDDNKYPPEGEPRPYLSLERQLTVGPHIYQLAASGADEERIGLTLVGWNAAGEVVSEISGGISPADLAPVADALTSTLFGLAALRRQHLAAPALAPGSASAVMAAPGSGPAVMAAPGSGPAVMAAPRSGPAAWRGSVPAGWPGPGAPADLVPGSVSASVAAAPAKRHRNQGARWSAEDDDLLTARYQAGATPKELMTEFGRSRGGITARLEHLGLVTPDGVPVARPQSDAPDLDPEGLGQDGDPAAAETGVTPETA
jgi:hypothetical protein